MRREIEAVNARRKEAELLKIPANKAVSLVITVAHSEDSPLPVEFSVARYHGYLNKFSVDYLQITIQPRNSKTGLRGCLLKELTVYATL